MTKISVNEKGELRVDGEPKKIADLTQEFLEKLVDDSLESKVDYEIEGDMPLAGFFETLRDGTKRDPSSERPRRSARRRWKMPSRPARSPSRGMETLR